MNIDQASAVLFPYFLDRQQDGTWVVLNRNHKPLGMNTAAFIEYDDYPVAIKLPLDQATLRQLSCIDEEPGDRVYLYRDDCAPNRSPDALRAYLQKLEILLSL